MSYDEPLNTQIEFVVDKVIQEQKISSFTLVKSVMSKFKTTAPDAINAIGTAHMDERIDLVGQDPGRNIKADEWENKDLFFKPGQFATGLNSKAISEYPSVTPEQGDSLMKLVQLSAAIKQELVATYGEITFDIEEKLMVLERKLPSKADGYKFVIDDLESEAELWKKRAAQFAKVGQGFGAYADRMKKAILEACKTLNTDEILGNEYRWKLQKAKPTVIIDDESKIPDGHKETVTITKIKKDGILEDLKQGLPVPGAHLEESAFVRCYPNTTMKKKEPKNVKPAESTQSVSATKRIAITKSAKSASTKDDGGAGPTN